MEAQTVCSAIQRLLHLLPVGLALLLAGDDTGEPFDRACPSHSGHHQPQRKAMICRQGPAAVQHFVTVECLQQLCGLLMREEDEAECMSN